MPIQRQELDQDTIAFCETQRAYHKASADQGDDDYLPAKDRRNREHVLGPLSRVKAGDWVLHNGNPVYVICAARGEGSFYALEQNPWSGNVDVPTDGQYITDRAPEDPEEEALPVFLEGWGEPEPIEPAAAEEESE